MNCIFCTPHAFPGCLASTRCIVRWPYHPADGCAPHAPDRAGAIMLEDNPSMQLKTKLHFEFIFFNFIIFFNLTTSLNFKGEGGERPGRGWCRLCSCSRAGHSLRLRRHVPQLVPLRLQAHHAKHYGHYSVYRAIRHSQLFRVRKTTAEAAQAWSRTRHGTVQHGTARKQAGVVPPRLTRFTPHSRSRAAPLDQRHSSQMSSLRVSHRPAGSISRCLQMLLPQPAVGSGTPAATVYAAASRAGAASGASSASAGAGAAAGCG